MLMLASAASACTVTPAGVEFPMELTYSLNQVVTLDFTGNFVLTGCDSG